MQIYYAVISCTLENYNKNIAIADPNREGHYAEAKKGVPLNTFSHNGEVLISLQFPTKSTFKKQA